MRINSNPCTFPQYLLYTSIVYIYFPLSDHKLPCLVFALHISPLLFLCIKSVQKFVNHIEAHVLQEFQHTKTHCTRANTQVEPHGGVQARTHANTFIHTTHTTSFSFRSIQNMHANAKPSLGFYVLMMLFFMLLF